MEEIMAAVKKAAVKKVATKKTVEIETRHIGVDWRSLYLYAVCLITLLVVLFSTVASVSFTTCFIVANQVK